MFLFYFFMILYLFLSCYLIGFLFSHKISKDFSFAPTIIFGFLIQIVIFEFLALPAIYFSLPFHILYYSFLIVDIFLLLLSIYLRFRFKTFPSLYSIKEVLCSIRMFHLLLFSIIIFQIIFVCSMQMADADDGAYIAISTIALDEDKVVLNYEYAYHGLNETASLQPSFFAWELYTAFLSKLFLVPPAITAHFVLPIFLIPFGYLIIWYTARIFFQSFHKKNNLSLLCLFFFALLIFFSGIIGTDGNYFFARPWTGKSLLFYVSLPVFLSVIYDIYQDDLSLKTWMGSFLALISGIMFSSSGLFIGPLFFICLIVPYGIWKLLQHNYKLFKKAFLFSITLAFCLLPLVIGAYIQILMSSSSAEDDSLSTLVTDGAITWDTVFSDNWGTIDHGHLLIYILALISILLFCNLQVRIMAFGGLTFALLTFLNPLAAPYVMTYITTDAVYWRLWLTIPFSFLVPYAFSVFIGHMNKKRFRNIAFFSLTLIVFLTGDLIFPKWAITAENPYHLSNEIIVTVPYILQDCHNEKAMVLYNRDLNWQVRQFSALLTTHIARNMERSEKTIIGNYAYKDLYHDIYYNNSIVSATTIEALQILDYDYIITETPLTLDTSKTYVLLHSFEDGYYIYKKNF